MRQSPVVFGLALLCGTPAFAQEPAAGPPSVLMVTREQFRPGNMATHNRQIPAFYALFEKAKVCLLYTSPSPRDRTRSRMPSSA